ncbi:MAG: PEP-utilizing enzyme [Candidatus Methanoperedens sp.]|nr:PEP-utilizing enzyme [Candidatus Methanoperedens sp.]CAG0962438.1 prodigiosin/undecylprodigiosin synthetase [Methanosarcinales archaeon]
MNTNEKQYFLDWEGSANSGITEVGGKGQNLGSLHRYGFLVPAGGVLTARAYQDFMQHNGLAELIHAAASIKAKEALENEEMLGEIRRKINEGHLPDAIWQELADRFAGMGLLDKPVAVRSSATAEDSARASFAGVHESFLNVRGLSNIGEAIRNCYASLWTPRAVAYRRKMGFGDNDVAAAVVIMELVPAVAAGIAFSCDPRTGRRDRIAISANFGLGESVVSGAVEPDEYLLHKIASLPEIVEKKIGSKKKFTRLVQRGGTELVNSGGEENGDKRPVLNDNQIIELGSLTLRVYEALGRGMKDQDMEWAFDGKKFHVLQARPVTNLREPAIPGLVGQPVIWSNANIKDAVPMVLTTLSWSLLCNTLDMMMNANLLAAGYRLPEGTRWVRLYKGRGYFNLSAFQWGLYDALGSLPAETNANIGGHQPEIRVPPGNPLGGLAGIKRIWRRIHLIINVLGTQHSAEKIFKDMWETVELWKQRNFHAMNDQELISYFSEASPKLLEYSCTYMVLGLSTGVSLTGLVQALDRDFPGRGAALANGLLAGASEITSAEHGYRLMELAKTVQMDKAARLYFTAEPFRPSAWKDEIPAGSQFCKEFEEFLKDYGHRGVYEAELLNPRWGEDPGYLLEIIRAQVLSPGNTDHRAVQAARREAAEKEIAAKLKWSLGRLTISMLTRQARKNAGTREMAKSVLVKPAEVSRMYFQELGRRLVERKILDEQANVYHCAWHELSAILAGYFDGSGLKILVEERKKMREELSSLEPPDVIIDDAPQQKAQALEAHGQLLAGIGVAAGRASGRARLIRHPRENTRLQAGDILVAPSTDPGWTPLFLRAKAVVMEIGGYLSHGAIVAREYGIPAVVNVPGVMKTLKDGEQITVDGDEGKVYRG